MSRYALNLPVDLKHEAELLAKHQGVSLNQFIMWAVSEKVASMRNGLDDPKFPLITYRRGGSGIHRPVIRGTAIHVQTVAVAINKLKDTPEKFAKNYGLDVKKVNEALGFYKVYKDEIDTNLKYERALEQEYKKSKKAKVKKK